MTPIFKKQNMEMSQQVVDRSSQSICNNTHFQNKNILYTSDGPSALDKEYIEVFGGGCSAKIIDFQQVEFFKDNKKILSKKYTSQEKGQKQMLSTWVNNIKSNEVSMSYDLIINSTLATILSVESLMIGEPLEVNSNILD